MQRSSIMASKNATGPTAGPRRWGRAQDRPITDPYMRVHKPHEPTICPQCGAVFQEQPQAGNSEPYSASGRARKSRAPGKPSYENRGCRRAADRDHNGYSPSGTDRQGTAKCLSRRACPSIRRRRLFRPRQLAPCGLEFVCPGFVRAAFFGRSLAQTMPKPDKPGFQARKCKAFPIICVEIDPHLLGKLRHNRKRLGVRLRPVRAKLAQKNVHRYGADAVNIQKPGLEIRLIARSLVKALQAAFITIDQRLAVV